MGDGGRWQQLREMLGDDLVTGGRSANRLPVDQAVALRTGAYATVTPPRKLKPLTEEALIARSDFFESLYKHHAAIQFQRVTRGWLMRRKLAGKETYQDGVAFA